MPFTETGVNADHDSVMWQLSYPLDEETARRLASDPGTQFFFLIFFQNTKVIFFDIKSKSN